MANPGTTERAPRSGQNRIFIFLLGFAVIFSVGKDLDRLQALTRNIHSLVSSQMGLTVQASEIAPVNSCPEAVSRQEKTEEFRWVGQVPSGQAIEIKGINGGISAEPAHGAEVEVFATKKARRSDPASVDIRVVPHVAGVTICAVYPGESGQMTSCEPSGRPSGSTNVVRNDVSVDFRVRVPAGVQFVGRTINGEIVARSLSGNVDTHTVNGSIDISTTGYARAKTVNGEIAARMGRGDWTDALEFKTVNGGIDLDLPSSLSTKVEADTFNGEISSEFPLTVQGKVSRKHLSGTIGAGGRELLLKTLNGSIRLRKVS